MTGAEQHRLELFAVTVLLYLIDITNRLTKVMLKNAKYLFNLARKCKRFGIARRVVLLYKFYKLVKTGGKWDLKNQKSWKLSKKNHFKFHGRIIASQDVGNIHFGFVGSVVFKANNIMHGSRYLSNIKWNIILELLV